MNVLIVMKCFGLMNRLKKKIFVKDVKEKAMSNLQNNHLIDVEQYFWDLLNDYSKTNDQALKIIKHKHGSLGHVHALSLIQEQEDEEQRYRKGV